MHDSILFKQIDLVLPDGIKKGDLLVKHGKIAAIDWQLPAHAEEIVSGNGLTLMPGGIDPHVHFRDPGFPEKETLETGSKAAASGGITSFLDMPNTNPATVTCDALEKKKYLASQTSLINYNFFIGATTENLEELIKAKNIPGIKVFMGSSTGTLLVDKQADLEAIFERTPHLIAVHAEDEDIVQANKQRYAQSQDVADHIKIRTPEAALKATQRAVALSNRFKKRLHICHLTTQEEAEFLALAKPGTLVTTEVCVQHLLLEAPQVYKKLGTLAQINPPIRERRHLEALWKALYAGTIDCVATDHAPHTLAEKAHPFGKAHSGMPGVETSLPLMLNQYNLKRCTLEQVVHWMSTAPAQLYGMKNKGKLSVGYDADLTLLDLKAKKTIENGNLHTKVNWSAFHGETLQGWPVMTVVHGNPVYREGDFFTQIKGKEILF